MPAPLKPLHLLFKRLAFCKEHLAFDSESRLSVVIAPVRSQICAWAFLSLCIFSFAAQAQNLRDNTKELLVSVQAGVPDTAGAANSTAALSIVLKKDTATLAREGRTRMAQWVLDSGQVHPTRQDAVPYYEAHQNPWQIYDTRYEQYIDVLQPTGLIAAHAIALAHLSGNQPYEQGRVFFPGPTSLYLDGRFVAYFTGKVIDLNKLRPQFKDYMAFYMNPSYQELTADRGRVEPKIKPAQSRAPYRTHQDSLLAGGFTTLLALLLGTRAKAFYRVFSVRSLTFQGAKALPSQGAEPIGWQSLVHLCLLAIGGGVFLYVYHYGQDPVLQARGPSAAWLNIGTLAGLIAKTALLVVALQLYVAMLGLSLFNLRLEGSHVRGNLETLSMGACVLGLWAVVYAFTGVATFSQFRMGSFYFCLIIFCIKGVLMYKVLVSDTGFRKFYGLSYICLTELLPSILLIRLLTSL